MVITRPHERVFFFRWVYIREQPCFFRIDWVLLQLRLTAYITGSCNLCLRNVLPSSRWWGHHSWWYSLPSQSYIGSVRNKGSLDHQCWFIVCESVLFRFDWSTVTQKSCALILNVYTGDISLQILYTSSGKLQHSVGSAPWFLDPFQNVIKYCSLFIFCV